MPTVAPSPVYDSYWRFAAARHDVYLRRLRGLPSPWTDDPIIASWRFTNAYRAADRVSQYLIRNVIYEGDQDPEETVFRILLFRWFNRISTWELLNDRLGPLRREEFDVAAADRLLSQSKTAGNRVYSAAYIVPPVPNSQGPKHAGHLSLTMRMLNAGLTEQLATAESLERVFKLLRAWPGIGDFLGYQLAIDINYSNVIDHDEDEFVVPGPGAIDGISKAWPNADLRKAADIIRHTAEEQEEQFERIGVPFSGLFGRRLKLIDCQNLYCEISKYSRAAHPEAVGVAGRTRIKQVYRTWPHPEPLPLPVFPPKWRLTVPGSLGTQATRPSPPHLALEFDDRCDLTVAGQRRLPISEQSGIEIDYEEPSRPFRKTSHRLKSLGDRTAP